VRRDAPLKRRVSFRHVYFTVFIVFLFLISNLTLGVNLTNQNKTNDTLSCQINFGNPILYTENIYNTNFTIIKMKDCISFSSTGEPALPVYPARILIPYDSDVKKIHVSHNKFELLSDGLKNKPVIPQQENLAFSTSKKVSTFKINKTSYNSNEPVFKNIFSTESIGFCKGYKLLTLYLYPVRYIPGNGLLYFTDKINIKIELQKNTTFYDKEYNQFFRNNKNDKKFVESLVENPSSIDLYNTDYQSFGGGSSPLEYNDGLCDPVNNFEYVIITNNSLVDTTGYSYNLSDLVSHRENYSGYNATIVTVEEIDACNTYWNDTSLYNDSQAHIREFCKDAYQDWNTEYILLAGDWDSTDSHKIVPYRLFTDKDEGAAYDSMACDMYYSHLDGDWYYSGSGGMWGGGKGGANDLHGELYVGRITCIDAETVSNAVYKIINYDINSSLTDSWLRSVSFWGGDLGIQFSVTSKEYMEEIRLGTDTHRTFTGFEEWNNEHISQQFNTSERLYHEDIGSGYKNYFDSSVESDSASSINHLGHSNIDLPFELTDWETRYNEKPFFGFSQGCLAGRFHGGESGCEQLICKYKNRHAYALVLNTGYGYGSGSNTDGPSQYINAYFWDYFLNNQSNNQDNWQLGKAMIYAQDKMSSVINSDDHSWAYSWYSANFFGDPAQKFRLNNTNNPVQTSNENPIDNATDISIDLSNLSISMYDSDGDTFNWSIITSPDIGNSTDQNSLSGIKKCNVSNLTFSTTYRWYVNITDDYSSTNETFTFTTRSQYIPTVPSSFAASAFNRTVINLTWGNSGQNKTYIEWNNVENWNKGEGISLDNSTNTSYSHTNLSFNTTYYYQAWSYNNTDKTWSENSALTNATTDSNHVPIFTNPSPENRSADQPINVNWTIQITDADGDLFNYTIECSNYQTSVNYSSDGTKYLNLSNLSYNTQYIIWVNATDTYNTKKSWYTFTTESLPIDNNPTNVTSENPENNSDDVSIDLSTLTVLIEDPDGDNFNWSIITSPDIGNAIQTNNTNGSKNCTISDLSYDTTYTWSVTVTDGIYYTNKTFYFTTEEQPRQNNNNNPAPIINSDPNQKPVADAGGPYKAYTNESISFNASESYDPDNHEITYVWDFGDNNTGSTKKIIHSYIKEGNYTITLTVTDEEGASDTDLTYAIISKKPENSETNKDDDIEMDNDTDKDGILDCDENRLGSDINNSSDAVLIQINNGTFYLIDTDKDGTFDLFFKSENKINTTLGILEENIVLIDYDGDNNWDFSYNVLDQTYSAYNPNLETKNPKTFFSNYLMILIIAITSIILLWAVFIIKKQVFVQSNGWNDSFIKNENSQNKVFHFSNEKEKSKNKKEKDEFDSIRESIDKLINSLEKNE